MAVATETLAIVLGGEQHSFPIFSFVDRRGRKPYRHKQWVLIRGVERLLYGVTEGARSTGRFALHLSKCTLADAVLVCDKTAVEDETLTQEEFEVVIAAMKTLVEPEARGRVRKASVVPITPCCSALSEFGRTDATTAIMKALNKMPKKWQLEIEKEANQEAFGPHYDPAVDDALAEMDEEGCDEHAEVTILHELVADFEPYAEIEEDNAKVTKLTTLCATLKKEIGEWRKYRSSTLNRLRVGTKVAETTHEHEVQTMLRFFGYMRAVCEMREPTMKRVFCDQGVGVIVEDYAKWLEAKQLKWSSIANYLAALVSAATFATVEMETPPPLDQLANLRRQAEKMAREETLYRKKAANWIDWPDVQKTRVTVIKKYNDAPQAQKAGILKDVVIVLLHSVTPPDRVGVIRKLRWNLSLKREGEDYVIDTTQQRHKTSKFYGPTKTTVSKLVAPWLKLYIAQLQFEFHPKDQPYLWSIGGDFTRCQTSSQWCSTVKAAFQRWSPNKTAVPPKMLRSSFITYLRGSDAAPEVLKSAATSMKHLIDTQASDVYDRETHDRLAKAAFDWCEEVAKKFDQPAPNGAPIAGAGSSGGAATAPIALAGEIECKRSDETPPEGKVFYLASIDWRDELYMGAVLDAFAAPINARLQFTVPVENTAFRVKMALATAVDGFNLTDLKLVSGAKEAAPVPAPPPEPAPPPAPPPEPIAVPAEYEATYAAQVEAPEGHRAFVATIAAAPPLYAGAKLSAIVVPLRTAFDFEVPSSAGESFEVTLKLPINAERVVLTEVRITSGPAPAATAPVEMAPTAAETTEAAAAEMAAAETVAAPAAVSEAANAAPAAEMAPAAAETAVEATATVVGSAFASAPAPPPAPAPARTKHAPIPLPGTYTATHKPNPKLAQGKTQFSVAMPWDDTMYPKAKVSLYCAPIAKVVQVTLGQKPQSGPLNITLTLPTQSTQSFQISGAAIVSGPKPLAPPPPAPVPPVPMPAPPQMQAPQMPQMQAPQMPQMQAPQMPQMQAPQMPIAAAIPIPMVVQQSLMQAVMGAQAASVMAPVAAAPVAAAQVAAPAMAPVAAAPAPAVIAQPVPSKKRNRSSGPAEPRVAAPKAAKPAKPKAVAKPRASTKPRPTAKPAAKKRSANPPTRPVKRARTEARNAAAPPVAAPAPAPASRSGRSVKAATRYGEKGEMETSAREWMSSPVPSKPPVPLAVEDSVPGFCLPGATVWATALVGGVKQHLGFKATVVQLRTRYPRIHVRYEADRAGNTARINLPEMREAYLMSDAIAEYDGA